jgi:hypothetical protein
MADAEKWAAGLPLPGYAIDDQTAIKVTDGTVEVVSEGHWKLFTPSTESPATGDGRFSDARPSVGSATPTSAAALRRSDAPVSCRLIEGSRPQPVEQRRRSHRCDMRRE